MVAYKPITNPHLFKDISGKQFGRLTVLKFLGSKKLEMFWLCRCDCGTIKAIRGNSLRMGKSKSCGCSNLESIKAIGYANRTHGMRFSPEYAAWRNMQSRCYNPNATRFADWGGRGIRVCQRWRDSFQAFLKDVGRRPSSGHQLDRKNNEGHYEPGNVRWATRSEQTSNQRPRRQKHI